jgi:protein-S-isoprenylcysteine O-methyltransferase Ste14
VSPAVISLVSVASILAFMAIATATRRRGLRRRGVTLERSGGLANAIAYFFFVPYLVILARPGPELAIPNVARLLGLALVPAGVAFAVWAILTLGRHYDLEIEVHQGHELVRRGPYRLVRHPVYAGLALHFACACVATGSLLLIAGTLFVTYPAFYLRAASEEQLLRRRFGAAYEAYAREVRMLVPLP